MANALANQISLASLGFTLAKPKGIGNFAVERSTKTYQPESQITPSSLGDGTSFEYNLNDVNSFSAKAIVHSTGEAQEYFANEKASESYRRESQNDIITDRIEFVQE